jgi:hypothetical protein
MSDQLLTRLYGTVAPVGAATTVFTIAHGMLKAPVWCGVTPGNALSAALFSCTWDATNITVTYLVALTGTLSLEWIAIA